MKPTLGEILDKKVSDLDPSDFMKTEKWLEAWYCLHNKNLTVVVDTIRPRVFRIYTHGKFGDFQNLLYDSNAWRELTGLCGIVPSYKIKGETATPFIPHAYHFEDFSKGNVRFDEKSNSVHIESIDCFTPGNLNDLIWSKDAMKDYNIKEHRRPPIDFAVHLEDNELTVKVKYPPSMEKGMLHLNLYPLYTHYAGEDKEKHIVEYFQSGFEENSWPHFDRVLGKTIDLEDEFCRLPRLTITSRTGQCRMVSQTDQERFGAFRLQVTLETTSQEEEIRVRLDKNPLLVKVPPLVPAGKKTKIQIDGSNLLSCTIDETEKKITKTTKNGYEVSVVLAEGPHELLVKSKSGFARRKIYAIEVSKKKIETMGNAILRTFWKDKDKKDIIPYTFDLTTLEPTYREGCGYCSHAVRALTLLALATRLLGDRKYVDGAYKCLKALVKKSHAFENGDLLLTIWLDRKGQPMLLDACRPSDLGIMVRGFLYVSKTYREIKQEKKSRECLNYAVRYARTLFRMQREDGAFYSRYSFPDAKPTSQMVGTVNNWTIQIWNLAEECRRYDSVLAKRFKELLEKYIDFTLFKKEPSQLKVTGGADEGPANYPDDLATLSANLTIKYLLTRDEKYKKYAQDAFKMSFCYRDHRLEFPQTYMYPPTPHMSFYNDLPLGLPGRGDMTDKTGNEAGLFLKKWLDDDFGEYVACLCTQSTFTDNFKSNGGLYICNIDVPNYSYKRRYNGYMNSYAGMGIVLYELTKNYLEKDKK
ncbi:MAG: hypothetical protein WC975_04445 [Phycisphaerae bacterium]